MLKVNDKDVCPKCGAYWQDNGYCANGHPHELKEEHDKLKKKKLRQTTLDEFGMKI